MDYDDEVIFHAQRYLYDQARKSDDKPFCLTVSMTHPHDPYTIPKEYWDRYQPEDIEEPRLHWEDVEQGPHSARLRALYQADTTDLSREQIRNARRAYYGAISYVDNQAGRLLRTLKETGQNENTIIVFSGDHGDMLGERGKRPGPCDLLGSPAHVRRQHTIHAQHPGSGRPGGACALPDSNELNPPL